MSQYLYCNDVKTYLARERVYFFVRVIGFFDFFLFTVLFQGVFVCRMNLKDMLLNRKPKVYVNPCLVVDECCVSQSMFELAHSYDDVGQDAKQLQVVGYTSNTSHSC